MKGEQRDFELSFFEGIVKRDPNFVDALIPLADLYTKKGLYKKGLRLDRRLAKLRPQDPGVHYNLACSLALVGEKEEALKALEHAVRLGYGDFEHLKKDPDLKSLREDPRFKSFLTQGKTTRT